MKDWKTTVCGVLTIVGSLCTAGIALIHGDAKSALAAVTVGVPTGVGLIKAADSAKALPPAQ